MLKTLNQSLNVLNLFTKEHERWTVREIAGKLDMNHTAVYRILETFVRNRYLIKNQHTKQYEIGPALALFSYLSYDKYNVATLTQPFLNNLMQETGESVYLVKLDHLEATTIDAFEPVNKVSFAVPLNKSMPLYSGASYWAILAYLEEEQIQSVLTSPFDQLRPTTHLNVPTLEKILNETREQGWCVSKEIVTPDIVAIAAPIFSNDVILGSLAIAKPTYRTKEEDINALGQLVKMTANQISAVLSENDLNLTSYRFFKEKALQINQV
ncbi:IclR family transcriptional regulator [Enterococcus olivae]